MFTIRFGVPEMESFWNDLKEKKTSGKISKGENLLFKQLAKTIKFLAADPKHPGLNSHEISPLSRKFGRKVFQSYLENNTPGAGRIFWVYGPERKEITIVGIEPHPEDNKRGAYQRIKLSDLPD
ncbi:hypothetical protein [Gracilimonas mengyeensis]|uniref:Uncharacterized protein n=1 Tax=Gracilimonas mengyeensis TaxID=1302730 RepID=A0A521BC12_9BACT|nr:hypothetical protein [Gracilimonas mengyeensis]SMO44290.1 hypothetical protein SAMN06265219_102148 [Gracilimonas mengyeensis]